MKENKIEAILWKHGLPQDHAGPDYFAEALRLAEEEIAYMFATIL